MVGRLNSLTIRAYDLPLRSDWVTSAGRTRSRKGWIVVAIDQDGVTGYGDCPADVPGHLALSVDGAALEQACRKLAGLPLEQALEAASSAGPLLAAAECALMDGLARRQGLPLGRFLAAGAQTRVAVNAVSTIEGAQAAALAGYPIVKLKVGLSTVEDEIAALRALRLPAGTKLRLDANRAWSWDQALRFLDGIADLPIESVEEPLAQPSLTGLADLQALTPLVLAIDESLANFGAQAVLDAAPVRRLVLKLGAVGGVGPSFALARQAIAAGIGCVVTSRVESAVGVIAAAHLAAAIDVVAPDGAQVHGLATSDWLAQDVCAPPLLGKGTLHLNETGGLGMTLP